MRAKITIELDAEEFCDLMDTLNEAKYLFNEKDAAGEKPVMAGDDTDYVDLAITAQNFCSVLEHKA